MKHLIHRGRHMTCVIATDNSQIIRDSAIIKKNMMKIVEQLAKQDKILETDRMGPCSLVSGFCNQPHDDR